MAALAKNNIQTGSISLAATDETGSATITAVDLTKAFVLFDAKCNDNGSENILPKVWLSNTTTVSVERAGTTNVASVAMTVDYMVVEFSAGLTVTHLTGSGNFNTNQSIGSTVDLGKTWATLSYHMDRASLIDNSEVLGVDIVSTTQFQVKCNSTTAQSVTNWAVQIIEFDSDSGANVEAATISLTATDSTKTATIGTVTVAQCMLIGSNITSENFAQRYRHAFRLSLDDTTTLRATRGTAAQTSTIYAFVIDWGSNVDIRSGTDTLTFAEGTSETQTFSALAGTADAIAFISGASPCFGDEGTSAATTGFHLLSATLDSTTQITVSRASGSNNSGVYQWQVIDFSGMTSSGVSGSGALSAGAPSTSGSGDRTVKGSGAMTASGPSTSGAGSRTVKDVVFALAVGQPTVSGSGSTSGSPALPDGDDLFAGADTAMRGSAQSSFKRRVLH